MSALISVDEALEFIAQNRAPSEIEETPLGEALGAVLAEPVIARVSRPPAAVSAMDGYAMQLSDVTEPGASLKIIGEAPAGTVFDSSVGSGEAVRIFTGGELPEGCDHVVPQERTESTGEQVTILDASHVAKCVRAAGLDFCAGDRVLDAGCLIGPAEISVAASANYSVVKAFRRPRVALLANGDELRPPGSTLARGQIISSNSIALSALVSQWGGVPIDLGIASDSVEAIKACVARAVEADIIVPIGGASVGDHDHMRRAFSELGFQPVFEKIAVKPGKPTWFSSKADQRVLGLPGNPASALVCAQLFLRPLVAIGADQRASVAKLATRIEANGPRETYLRAIAELDESGALIVRPLPNQDSSLLSPFLRANCLIRRPPHADMSDPGELVSIVLIGPLSGVAA